MRSPRSPLLSRLGREVRRLRLARGWSRAALGQQAAMSERFLNELEAGRGNISLERLERLAVSLGIQASELVARCEGPSVRHIALLGLRGAGKSTIGKAAAKRVGMRFVELDELVEQDAGLSLREVFELQGEAAYRAIERNVLKSFVEGHEPAIIATGGGIVTDPQAMPLLNDSALTVWLRARPEDHMDRVKGQGDLRPMQNRRNAMAELRGLLKERSPLYARADHVIDTSALGLAGAVTELAGYVTERRPA